VAPDPIAMIKVAASAIGALKHIRPREESSDARVQKAVSLFLRDLYFAPDGIVSLLREIADGEYPSETRLKQALVDFNDREWKVDEALKGLEFGVLKKELGLSLSALQALFLMRESKSELRWSVQQEVNYYGQDGVWPDRAKVRKLIQAIEYLNTKIEQIEAVINGRASGRILPKNKVKQPASRNGTKSRRRSPRAKEKGASDR
jgi:hypothetical protein